MQYKLKYTRSFRQGYKRAQKRGLDLSLLGDVVEMLRCGKKLPEKYADHWLSAVNAISKQIGCSSISSTAIF